MCDCSSKQGGHQQRFLHGGQNRPACSLQATRRGEQQLACCRVLSAASAEEPPPGGAACSRPSAAAEAEAWAALIERSKPPCASNTAAAECDTGRVRLGQV